MAQSLANQLLALGRQMQEAGVSRHDALLFRRGQFPQAHEESSPGGTLLRRISWGRAVQLWLAGGICTFIGFSLREHYDRCDRKREQ